MLQNQKGQGAATERRVSGFSPDAGRPGERRLEGSSNRQGAARGGALVKRALLCAVLGASALLGGFISPAHAAGEKVYYATV